MIQRTSDKGCLTPRELDVLILIAQEHTIKEIASSLFIGQQTVITHRKNIMTKLEARNAVGIIVTALQRGILNLR